MTPSVTELEPLLLPFAVYVTRVEAFGVLDRPKLLANDEVVWLQGIGKSQQANRLIAFPASNGLTCLEEKAPCGFRPLHILWGVDQRNTTSSQPVGN